MKAIKLSIPKGYSVPEGVLDKTTFDESVTFKLEGDKLCLTAINGIALPGYEEDAGSKSTPSPEAGLAGRFQAAMQQPAV